MALRLHRVQGDMAAVYIVNLGSNDQGQMSLAITNDVANHFGVSESELYGGSRS